jgi:hypothetical protein
MKIYKIVLCLLFSAVALAAFAQADINNESFKFNFVSGKGEAKVIYNGKSHAFSFKLSGNMVKQSKASGGSDSMQFFDIDTSILQSSFVLLPQPIPDAMQLSQLTERQQRETLEGYVNYELAYLHDDLKLNLKNIRKEWITVNSRFFMVWSFDTDRPPSTPETMKTFSGQVYFSTICFNLVLDLNTPFGDSSRLEPSKKFLTQIANSLTIYNNRLNTEN